MHTLQLALVDPEKLGQTSGNSGDFIVALGTCNDDSVIEKLPSTAADLAPFLSLRDSVDKVVLQGAIRPTKDQLTHTGNALYKYLFSGKLASLYDAVPQGRISIQILSNSQSVCGVPWEYLSAPTRTPAPHRECCVVRIVPTCGVSAREPKKLNQKLKVLFVVADPIDQPGIAWNEVRLVIERALVSQLVANIELTVVEGANRKSLSKTIRNSEFDIFHFFGHGTVINGVGQLVLVDLSKQNRSDFLAADELASLLSGKDCQVALLSACLSGAGNHEDDFSVIADALIRSGSCSAVIANQMSVPIKSVAPFVDSVYSTLLSSGNIDDAVMEGRISLAIELKGTVDGAVIEWGIPVLYRLPSAQIVFQKS
jgi:CHAT domain